MGSGGGIVSISPGRQIIDYLDAPKREDKYHRTQLDNMKLGDVTTEQLQHYLACRRRMEQHLDEETVFGVLCRLWHQRDEETCDLFDRITTGHSRLAQRLADEAAGTGVGQDRLASIALGMLGDGWADDEVRYALGTLGAAA